jgi:hypothetical protein
LLHLKCSIFNNVKQFKKGYIIFEYSLGALLDF